MVKNAIKYPNPTIKLISANVRFFDDELRGNIQDMIDTMKANNLDALSGILIGLQYNIMVIKNENSYVPYINGRFIKHSGKSTATERSPYYDGISVDVERYEYVTLIYEDENGNQLSKDLSGEEARTFQHYLDYCFGSTFVDRVDRDVKERLDAHLEFGLVKDAGPASCAAIFYSDYFKRSAEYLVWSIWFTFLSPFFFSEDAVKTMVHIDKYLLILAFFMLLCYFVYAGYESKKYKQCTSCQAGNMIGVAGKFAVKLLLAVFGLFLWLK